MFQKKEKSSNSCGSEVNNTTFSLTFAVPVTITLSLQQFIAIHVSADSLHRNRALRSLQYYGDDMNAQTERRKLQASPYLLSFSSSVSPLQWLAALSCGMLLVILTTANTPDEICQMRALTSKMRQFY